MSNLLNATLYEFVGQTQSSHQLQIRAGVAGFLDRRLTRSSTERVDTPWM